VTAFTAIAEPGNVPPRIALELTWPEAPTATVERLDPDGRWRPVRTGEPATIVETWLGYDYEAPYGDPVSYRATSGDGLVINAGPGSFSGTDFPDLDEGMGVEYNPDGSVAHYDVVLDVPAAWLIHPGVPSLSCPLRVVSVSERTRPARRGVFDVIGRQTPVVASQRRKAGGYEVKLRTLDDAAAAALEAALDDSSPLLLNIPTSLGWLLRRTWVSVGDLVVTPYTDLNGRDHRLVWTLPVLEVDRPSGAQQAQWTLDDLQAERLTFDDLTQGYGSFADVAAHRSRAAAGRWTFEALTAEGHTFDDLAAAYATVRDLTAHRAA
jgi:hypothetical protein